MNMRAVKKTRSWDVLRTPCSDVHTQEEAEIIIKTLERVLLEKPSFASVSAPEVNILKKAAIIRLPKFSIDLVNPIIVDKKEKIISFSERCVSFDETVNCFRWSEITIENGLSRERLTFSGILAILVQHEIDHINGHIFFDKAIKMALVRNEGRIKLSSLCPCGSKKAFSKCCLNN